MMLVLTSFWLVWVAFGMKNWTLFEETGRYNQRLVVGRTRILMVWNGKRESFTFCFIMVWSVLTKVYGSSMESKAIRDLVSSGVVVESYRSLYMGLREGFAKHVNHNPKVQDGCLQHVTTCFEPKCIPYFVGQEEERFE